MPPGNTNAYSLANSAQLDFPSLDLSIPGFENPTQGLTQTANSLRNFQMPKPTVGTLAPEQSLAGVQPPSANSGFFASGNSFMDNAGQVLGLAGGVASLADVLNNWGVAKDAMQTNMANVKQQMTNNQEAFDLDKARQARSLAAVNNANSLALSNAGG